MQIHAQTHISVSYIAHTKTRGERHSRNSLSASYDKLISQGMLSDLIFLEHESVQTCIDPFFFSFWECENNCVGALISQPVSEHILWADSRDKPISLLLALAPNSLWLIGQSTEACRGVRAQTHAHTYRHEHTFFTTRTKAPLSHLVPPPQTGGNPPRSPTLQRSASKNYLTTNPACVCVYMCVFVRMWMQRHTRDSWRSLKFDHRNK